MRIVYLATAEVRHFGGQSRAQATVRAGEMGFISMFEYFRRSRGPFHAALYRLTVQVIQMPMLLLVGLGKAAIKRDPSVLRERYRLAAAIWAWRPHG
jgi:hypothetical protein